MRNLNNTELIYFLVKKNDLWQPEKQIKYFCQKHLLEAGYLCVAKIKMFLRILLSLLYHWLMELFNSNSTHMLTMYVAVWHFLKKYTNKLFLNAKYCFHVKEILKL